MLRKNKNKGFSLIELIIVIAILAVLVAIVAPQYFQYVEKSRKAVCVNNRDEIRRQYAAALLMSKADGDVIDESAILAEVMMLSGGKEAGKVNGMDAYTGVCPSSGKVSGAFDKAGNVMLYCTEHGAENADAMAGAISNAILIEKIYPVGGNTLNYLKDGGKYGKQLDSEAPTNSTSLSGYTKVIKEALGPVVDRDCTWAVMAQKSTANTSEIELVVYVTTGPKLTTEDNKRNDIEVIKYVYDQGGTLLSTSTEKAAVILNKASVKGADGKVTTVDFPALKL